MGACHRQAKQSQEVFSLKKRSRVVFKVTTSSSVEKLNEIASPLFDGFAKMSIQQAQLLGNFSPYSHQTAKNLNEFRSDKVYQLFPPKYEK